MSLLRKVFAKIIGTNDEEIGSFNNSLNIHDSSIDIARGLVAGSQPFGAYGKLVTSVAVDNNVLWANGIWSIPPAIGTQISVASTSAEDGVGGTGIRSLHLHYLDVNLEIQTEIITTNGTTPVLSVATDMRFIQCSHINTYGSTKAAVGDIIFSDAVTTDAYNQIDALSNRCSSSMRMVPKGKRGVIMGAVGSCISGTAAAGGFISLVSSYFAGHDYTEDTILIPFSSIGLQDGSQAVNLPIPLTVPEGAVVGMICSVDKAATLTGDWFGWLEDV